MYRLRLSEMKEAKNVEVISSLRVKKYKFWYHFCCISIQIKR